MGRRLHLFSSTGVSLVVTLVDTHRGLTILEMLGVLTISTLLLSEALQLFQGGMRSYQGGMQEVR